MLNMSQIYCGCCIRPDSSRQPRTERRSAVCWQHCWVQHLIAVVTCVKWKTLDFRHKNGLWKWNVGCADIEIWTFLFHQTGVRWTTEKHNCNALCIDMTLHTTSSQMYLLGSTVWFQCSCPHLQFVPPFKWSSLSLIGQIIDQLCRQGLTILFLHR